MSMLSLAEAQSAREQKGKHRPPDARAAQQQRWAETVEHWASEADAAWKLLSEARGRLRSADVALRGEQGRFAQSHTRGYTTFTRGEHGVRIPSPETVAGEVGNWTAVFNKGVRRVTGVAPWGARSSSLPGYLRLSASSRRLLLVFISVWLGLAARRTALSSASLPLLRSGRGLGRCRLLPLPGIGLRFVSVRRLRRRPSLGGGPRLRLPVRRRGVEVAQGRGALDCERHCAAFRQALARVLLGHPYGCLVS